MIRDREDSTTACAACGGAVSISCLPRAPKSVQRPCGHGKPWRHRSLKQMWCYSAQLAQAHVYGTTVRGRGKVTLLLTALRHGKGIGALGHVFSWTQAGMYSKILRVFLSWSQSNILVLSFRMTSPCWGRRRCLLSFSKWSTNNLSLLC